MLECSGQSYSSSGSQIIESETVWEKNALISWDSNNFKTISRFVSIPLYGQTSQDWLKYRCNTECVPTSPHSSVFHYHGASSSSDILSKLNGKAPFDNHACIAIEHPIYCIYGKQ